MPKFSKGIQWSEELERERPDLIEIARTDLTFQLEKWKKENGGTLSKERWTSGTNPETHTHWCLLEAWMKETVNPSPHEVI